MKVLTLSVLLLFSSLSFANYWPEQFVDGAIHNDRPVFVNKADCENHYKNLTDFKECVRLPFGYNHEYHVLADHPDLLKRVLGKKVVEMDGAKKFAYDEAENAKRAQRQSRRNQIKLLKNKLVADIDPSPDELREVLKFLLKDLE